MKRGRQLALISEAEYDILNAFAVQCTKELDAELLERNALHSAFTQEELDAVQYVMLVAMAEALVRHGPPGGDVHIERLVQANERTQPKKEDPPC